MALCLFVILEIVIYKCFSELLDVTKSLDTSQIKLVTLFMFLCPRKIVGLLILLILIPYSCLSLFVFHISRLNSINYIATCILYE